MRGDKLDIPITISNNRYYQQKVAIATFEYALYPQKTTVNSIKKEITLPANGQKQIVYNIDTGSDGHKD